MIATTIPLVPKNPNGPLQVIMLGRISTVHQDLANIDASYRFAETFLQQVFTGAYNIRHLGEQASGMLADRPTIVEAEELIQTGAWDLVLVEDLSRIFRNPRFQWAFVQNAVDSNTRVICIADNIDTADPNWETMMCFGSVRHGMFVPDTRRRVRRTADNSFANGGMVLKCRFGYRKLSKEEAQSGAFGPAGLRIARIDECTPTIRAMRDRVVRGDTYDSVAAWLNDEGIVPGRYVTCGRWTGRLVEDFLRDPILSGTRTFRDVVYTQVYRTGKHRRQRNPNGPEQKHYPELAHFTAQEHEEVLAAMNARKGDREFPTGPDSPMWRRPRSHTLWPGQHAHCAVCGELMYRYGSFLKCKNAVPKGPRTCWNHVQVDIATVHAKIIAWFIGVLDRYPDARDVVVTAALEELERRRHRSRSASDNLDARITTLRAEADNLARAIAAGGELDALVRLLASVNASLEQAVHERACIEQQANEVGGLLSYEDVSTRLEEVLLCLANSSFEFTDIMRRMVPEFTIVPVQALDCAQIRPRARLTMRLGPPACGDQADVGEIVTLDLFDPPVHVQHLKACVATKKEKPSATYKEIAHKLGTSYMTVKRAFDYHRLMQAQGVTDPYREVTEEPTNASRWTKRERGGHAICVTPADSVPTSAAADLGTAT